MTMLNKIDKYFKLNPDLIGDTGMYLGAKLSYHSNNNGLYTWQMTHSN